MRTFIFTILFFCSLSIATAQNYHGKLIDEENYPIAYANVIAKTIKNGNVVAETITDGDGNFKIKTNTQKKLSIEISYVGFKTLYIIPEKENLGQIILKKGDIELQQVVATARKKLIEQKTDRLVFNVENSVAADGGNALDVLKKTPSVNVQNDNISIIGKGSVQVMINDRIVRLSGEELVNYLNTIASNNIKNIEVITTPPSKYDAEGSGGLINIVLKKARSNSWSNQIHGSYIQTTYPAFSLGNTFNYNHNKWSILASINGKKGYEKNTMGATIHYPSGLRRDFIDLKEKQDYFSGRLGVDYQINPKASVGFVYSGSYSQEDEINKGFTFNQNTEGNFKNNSFNINPVKRNSLNLHYLQKLDTLGRKLSVDLDYFNYDNSQNNTIKSFSENNNQPLLNINNIGAQKINNLSAKADVEHPFSWANISYGGKLTHTKTDNNIALYNLISGNPVLDNTQTDHFIYTENIQALYADISKSFGKKWQTKLGLRWENTQTVGTSESTHKNIQRSYNQFFPTFYLSYVANENNTFNLNYNRRISRPNFWSVNPFRVYINANVYQEGNPFLQPDFNNNIELQHTYKGMFITKLFGYMSSGQSSSITKVNPTTRKQVYTTENYYDGYVFGINEMILYNPFKWWNTTTSLSTYHMSGKYINGYDLGVPFRKSWVYNIYMNHSFLLNTKGTLSAELSFNYDSRQNIIIYDIAPKYSLDLGMKMQFLNKKLVLSLYANDILKSSIKNIKTNINGIKQSYDQYYDSRYFKVSLSYKFGNNKIRVREHNSGNEDIQGRTK